MVRPRASCRSGCRGSARISGSMRSPRSSSSWSIWAAPPPALYGLGYGRHEQAPGRVLPFFPAFLAGMNLVVLADDAFTFLLAWEFMSLTSWALVMAHHRERDNAQAGLRLSGDGELRHAGAAARLRPARRADGGYAFEAIRSAEPAPERAALVLALVLLGRRLQGRPRAACTSGCRSPTRRRPATSRR